MAVADKTENQEPTMEEILASIRRIISEDGATVQAAPPPEEGVLDLTELLETPAVPASPAPSSNLEVVMEDSAPEAAPAVMMAAAPSAPLAPRSDDRLISDVTAQAAASVLSTLSSPQRGGMETPIGNGARTLESMVLEIIRPVLKDWLDRNLPGLVERIVTKEVRKITRDIG